MLKRRRNRSSFRSNRVLLSSRQRKRSDFSAGVIWRTYPDQIIKQAGGFHCRREKSRSTLRRSPRYAGDKWLASHLAGRRGFPPRTTKSVFQNSAFLPRSGASRSLRAAAGYGYVGGCVPVQGGIVLSLERMKRIIEINSADFVAVVQAGVVTAPSAKRSRKTRAVLSA